MGKRGGGRGVFISGGRGSFIITCHGFSLLEGTSFGGGGDILKNGGGYKGGGDPAGTLVEESCSSGVEKHFHRGFRSVT